MNDGRKIEGKKMNDGEKRKFWLFVREEKKGGKEEKIEWVHQFFFLSKK